MPAARAGIIVNDVARTLTALAARARRPTARSGRPSRAVWIDTHCHLDAAEFDPDRDAVVERARAAGVAQIVIPAVDAGNFDAVRELAHRHGLAYALGIHPMCSERAGRRRPASAARSAARAIADDPRLVAVGEIGLDHFVPGSTASARQRCSWRS